jgi:hypothetical protein
LQSQAGEREYSETKVAEFIESQVKELPVNLSLRELQFHFLLTFIAAKTRFSVKRK